MSGYRRIIIGFATAFGAWNRATIAGVRVLANDLLKVRHELAEARVRVIPTLHLEQIHTALTARVYELALEGRDELEAERADAALAWLRRSYPIPRPTSPSPKPVLGINTRALDALDRKAVS